MNTLLDILIGVGIAFGGLMCFGLVLGMIQHNRQVNLGLKIAREQMKASPFDPKPTMGTDDWPPRS